MTSADPTPHFLFLPHLAKFLEHFPGSAGCQGEWTLGSTPSFLSAQVSPQAGPQLAGPSGRWQCRLCVPQWEPTPCSLRQSGFRGLWKASRVRTLTHKHIYRILDRDARAAGAQGTEQTRAAVGLATVESPLMPAITAGVGALGHPPWPSRGACRGKPRCLCGWEGRRAPRRVGGYGPRVRALCTASRPSLLPDSGPAHSSCLVRAGKIRGTCTSSSCFHLRGRSNRARSLLRRPSRGRELSGSLSGIPGFVIMGKPFPFLGLRFFSIK